MPSTEIALRALEPLSAVENEVEVSTLPATSMRAADRKTVAAVVLATPAFLAASRSPPRSGSGRTTRAPGPLRRLAEPAIVNGCMAPLAAVGSATVETSVPSIRRSSTKTAVEAALSALCPSPTRTTRKVSALQLAVASQTLAPSLEQIVPAGSFGFEATPALQRSLVQGLPSTGRSVSSIAETTLPLPSQMALVAIPDGVGDDRVR